MYIKEIKYIEDFYGLKMQCWSGALQTLEDIEKNNKQDELMTLLEDIYYDSSFEGHEVDITKLNDFLWFDRDYIYEQLEIEYE